MQYCKNHTFFHLTSSSNTSPFKKIEKNKLCHTSASFYPTEIPPPARSNVILLPRDVRRFKDVRKEFERSSECLEGAQSRNAQAPRGKQHEVEEASNNLLNARRAFRSEALDYVLQVRRHITSPTLRSVFYPDLCVLSILSWSSPWIVSLLEDLEVGLGLILTGSGLGLD